MRKLVLLTTAFLSFNCFAATNLPHHFNSLVMNSLQNHATIMHDNVKLYGGKDFSHEVVADANETNYSNQPIAVG